MNIELLEGQATVRSGDQISFDPLAYADVWSITIEKAQKMALEHRGTTVKTLKKMYPGVEVKLWTLTDQLQKYRRFGVEDGRVRNVYYITIVKLGG